MKSTLYQYALRNVFVVDGDTLKGDLDLGFNVSLTAVKVRLEHVNCPEKNTAEGVAAKDFTLAWIAQKTAKQEPIVVMVKNHREDKYGRILGSIFSAGEDLAQQIKLANHGVDYEGGKR
jgi:micrococcal nuclease